jgi:hypothetical protein
MKFRDGLIFSEILNLSFLDRTHELVISKETKVISDLK